MKQQGSIYFIYHTINCINVLALTFQIGFQAGWVLKVTSYQGGSFCIGTQHLHTLQIGSLVK